MRNEMAVTNHAMEYAIEHAIDYAPSHTTCRASLPFQNAARHLDILTRTAMLVVGCGEAGQLTPAIKDLES